MKSPVTRSYTGSSIFDSYLNGSIVHGLSINLLSSSFAKSSSVRLVLMSTFLNVEIYRYEVAPNKKEVRGAWY